MLINPTELILTAGTVALELIAIGTRGYGAEDIITGEL